MRVDTVGLLEMLQVRNEETLEPAPSKNVNQVAAHAQSAGPAREMVSRFEGDALLRAVASGKKQLGRGSEGPSVKAVQTALEDLGYRLPRFGHDGHFGAETARQLKAFQADQGLAATGALDARTMKALEKAAPSPGEKATLFPEYRQLFADGVLTVTMGVGFDEYDWDLWEREALQEGLATRGFKKVASMGEEERKGLGLSRTKLAEEALYYAKRTKTEEGKEVTVLLEYVDRSSPHAKERFAAGLAKNELVLYGGHARYGSGPDFDHMDSNAGNFVLGANAKGHRSGALAPSYDAHMRERLAQAPNDLEAAKLTPAYQLMFFAGCRTSDYLDELRGIPKNKDRKNLDLVASGDLLQWSSTSQNLLTMLDGVMAGKSINHVQDQLEQANKVPFVIDGFGGNPRAKGG